MGTLVDLLRSLEPWSWLAAIIAALGQFLALGATLRQADQLEASSKAFDGLPDAIRASGEAVQTASGETLSTLKSVVSSQDRALRRAQQHHQELALIVAKGERQ